MGINALNDLHIKEIRVSVGNVIDAINFVWSNVEMQKPEEQPTI